MSSSPRSPLSALSADERAAVLLRSWWGHDGQWFLKTRARFGLEVAMELNEAAIESVGRVEMRALHEALGAPAVTEARDFLPLVLAMHELLDLPAEAEEEDADAFVLRETRCRAWEMTVAAELEQSTPGCRGSMRRRLGWATVFFPAGRAEWSRTSGPPLGDATLCAYRFRLLPE